MICGYYRLLSMMSELIRSLYDGDLEKIKCLIEEGADVNAEDEI